MKLLRNGSNFILQLRMSWMISFKELMMVSKNHYFLFIIILSTLSTWAYSISIGDGVYWKTEENEIQIENLRNELQEKEESMKALKAKLVSVEKERYKQEREFDLLRQSLRIMNGKKNSIQTKEKKRFKTKLGKWNA